MSDLRPAAGGDGDTNVGSGAQERYAVAHSSVRARPLSRLPNRRRDRSLASQDVAAFADLVAKSELCIGGHIGTDRRAVDGHLETLMTGCAGGTVAVLVTSGNPTFANGARRELLELIRSREDELRKSATTPK